jgi:hypothetical protein
MTTSGDMTITGARSGNLRAIFWKRGLVTLYYMKNFLYNFKRTMIYPFTRSCDCEHCKSMRDRGLAKWICYSFGFLVGFVILFSIVIFIT